MMIACFNSLLFLSFLAFSSANVPHLYGTCYQQYIPPQNGFPSARCRHPMGGNPVVRGIFIRNKFTCCRRRTAHGWGSASHCHPCSAIRGFLRPWGAWSVCSATCGWGQQRRYRHCSNGVCAGIRGRREMEKRACLWKTCCPVDGNWSEWSGWSHCSASCGDGLQYRTRSCSSPAPSCGGRACRSYPRQMQRCKVGYCAHWSAWTIQSLCSVTCGNGVIRRKRECHSQMGDKCIGESVHHTPCNRGTCQVSGGWCSWGSWSSCTSSCADTLGTRKRERSCNCPSPRDGGKYCSGSDGDVKYCYSDAQCPVHGGWSGWSWWSECSAAKCSPVPGTQQRKRLCNNPYPRNGGSCHGVAGEGRGCMVLGGCEVEGIYGKWSSWSRCSASCGMCGRTTRFRPCLPFVNQKKITVIGEPKIICQKQKAIVVQTCNQEPCPDGTVPCGPTTTAPMTTLPLTESPPLLPVTRSLKSPANTNHIAKTPFSTPTTGTTEISQNETMTTTAKNSNTTMPILVGANAALPSSNKVATTEGGANASGAKGKTQAVTYPSLRSTLPDTEKKTIMPDIIALFDDTFEVSEKIIMKEANSASFDIPRGEDVELSPEEDDLSKNILSIEEEEVSLPVKDLEESQGDLDISSEPSDKDDETDSSGDYSYAKLSPSEEDSDAGVLLPELDIPPSSEEELTPEDVEESLNDILDNLASEDDADEVLRKLEEEEAKLRLEEEEAIPNEEKRDLNGEILSVEETESADEEEAGYDYEEQDEFDPFSDVDAARLTEDESEVDDGASYDSDEDFMNGLSLEDSDLPLLTDDLPQMYDDELPEYDYEESGEEDESEMEEQPIRGCDDLNRVRGQDASVANGCCEVLTQGFRKSTTANETRTPVNESRLAECFLMHFKYSMDFSGDMVDEDELLSRGAGRKCMYAHDARLLDTICCLRKHCEQWPIARLRFQCKICRGRKHCQSCHQIILSG